MKTRHVVSVAIVAALYAVFTVALAPFSYAGLQFRVSEVFKVLCLFSPWAALGIGIGNFFGNLASPFVGPGELIWMPLTDIVGGLAAYYVFRALGKRWPALPVALFALSTAAAVAIMLSLMSVGFFVPLFVSIAASELIIMVGGMPIMLGVMRAVRARSSSFLTDGE